MPLYEYECDACKQRFEVIQKFSDPAPAECARCGKGPVHRLMSTPAIQFKGSGWYITDYAGGRSSAATSTSATDGESKADSKKDSDKKPAAESSPKGETSGSSTTPAPAKAPSKD